MTIRHHRGPRRLTQPLPVDVQRQRIETVALALCDLDDAPPGGPAWGAYINEAVRHVAAFDALQIHADAVADARCGDTREH